MKVAKPDMSNVWPWASYVASETDDRKGREELYSRARNYLETFEWCLEIEESYVGMLFPPILGIFLFRIVPGGEADEWIWIFVGDIPPAYITVDGCSNAAQALDGYIGAMEQWVDAVDAGRSVADLIPVNAPQTKEYADMLRRRLKRFDEYVLSEFQDQL